MQRVTAQRVTVSATGHSAMDHSECNRSQVQRVTTFLRSMKKAVVLRVPVQQATMFAQYRDLYVIYAGWPEQ